MVSVSIIKGEYFLTDGDKSIKISKITTDSYGTEWLNLPTNSANRKYMTKSKVDEKGTVNMEYRETRTLGPRSESTPKKSWTEYLTDAEKITYEELKTACEKRKAEDIAKPKSELEKALEKVEKYQALVAKLQMTPIGE